jgi:pimeloyl-ACP methyl ester carboxylesterase/DNA-binding winged helix-turn-helix (wHTH) protein
VIRYSCPTEAVVRVTQSSSGEFSRRPHHSEIKRGDGSSGSRGVHHCPPMTAGETAGSAAPEAWRFDDFVLDAMQYELRRSGVAVPVEPQVFEMLTYLVSNHHRLVGRDELMDAIWGAGYGSQQSLSTRIKAARRALGDNGASQDYIRTVRGRGYQFVGNPIAILRTSGGLPPSPLPTQRVAFSRARDGVRLAYGVTGSGPPLVRAANWMTHLGYDIDSPVWRHWVSDLAARHTLVRYDERGCGLSEWDVGEFTFEDWLTDLESVVDTLGLRRFPVLGISQGGAVAAAYAARHPERVSKLILVGAYAQGEAVRDVNGTEHRPSHLDLELARQGWGANDPAFRRAFTAQFRPDGNPEDWDAFDDLQRLTTSPQNAVRFLERFAAIDVRDEIRAVTCPTLILHSRNDHHVPYRCAQQLTASIPGARLVSLDSANHLLTAHEPAWQVFLDEVHCFLQDSVVIRPAFAGMGRVVLKSGVDDPETGL